jgi:hypothetical protein
MAYYLDTFPDDGRTCPNCEGFGRVAVTTGASRSDGSRVIVFTNCLGCNGLGWLSIELITDIYNAAIARREASRV